LSPDGSLLLQTAAYQIISERTMREKPFFLGIDLGTTGIRAILCDEKGTLIGSEAGGIEKSYIETTDPRASEQDPKEWGPVLMNVLKKVCAAAGGRELTAACCDSTSGTIIPVDKENRPLYHALLHNDSRAGREAAYINERTSLAVKPSFALSKILWLKDNMPNVWEKTHRFIHAADYIKGIITGDFKTTDFSNAVKTGYDLTQERWPEEIENILGIPLERLPAVVRTGTVAGEISKTVRDELRIGHRVPVVAGATDSTTGFYSSGACAPGDWNTTLGTVLGIKGIAPEYIRDPQGLLYAHRHPEGYWLPGAASACGGEALRAFFGDTVSRFDGRIAGMPPTGALIYPLIRKGEKLPFFNNDATGFIETPFCDPDHFFKGILEGLSFVERMIYEKIERLGYPVSDTVFSMGGGTNSGEWMRIRASVIKKTVKSAAVTETAFGSCVIAAGGSYYGTLSEAVRHMVRTAREFEPDDRESAAYDEIYLRFVDRSRSYGLF
jgi:sugar (pentulose or hexulose) kinase